MSPIVRESTVLGRAVLVRPLGQHPAPEGPLPCPECAGPAGRAVGLIQSVPDLAPLGMWAVWRCPSCRWAEPAEL